MKDSLNQDVNIGDWIATVPKGQRSVMVGKVTKISKTGNPVIKRNINSKEESVGLTVSSKPLGTDPRYITIWNPTGIYYGECRKAHFIKIIPTREVELAYEI